LAEADLIKTLKYLQEREKKLSNYSDKLRQAWIKISEVFGLKKYCRICWQTANVHPDKHPEVLKYGAHQFTPKIEVSIDIIDGKPFYSDEGESYYLAIIDHYLKIVELPKDVKPTTLNAPNKYTWPMWNAPRWLLKQLTKSGRLLGFLQHVASVLEKAEKEYSEVADLAEKLAKALQPMWPPKSPSEIIP